MPFNRFHATCDFARLQRFRNSTRDTVKVFGVFVHIGAPHGNFEVLQMREHAHVLFDSAVL